MATVKYKTRDGTALAGSDYEASEGIITFAQGEEEKILMIKVQDDNAYEENEEFYIDLTDPQVEDTAGCMGELSDIPIVTVVIIDDDEPGKIKFKEEEIETEEGNEERTVDVVVERLNGASGTIGCRYYTEDMVAIAGMDYAATQGKIVMAYNVQTTTVPVVIFPRGRFEKKAGFNVVLVDPVGCKFDETTDGGSDQCVCHVVIKGKSGASRKTLITRMESKINTQQTMLGHRNWARQFYDAIFSIGGDDDDDDDEDDLATSIVPTGSGSSGDNPAGAKEVGGDAPEAKACKAGPSKLDWVMHILGMPWKLLFAFVPPVDYCGGWACFCCSLIAIAVVTAIVGDMANLVGCTLDWPAEITAITFVALGTSLPDTFASKTAAIMDPFADASIGNITGSNSVNVFIGLGLSWTMAAFYWNFQLPSAEWENKLQPGGLYYEARENVRIAQKNNGGNAVFVTPAGSLANNLAVFSANAFFAIQLLAARRRKFGGELGGPKRGFLGQYFSAAWLVFQWCIYIGASTAIALTVD